jgi:hypothetical protein
MHWRRYGHVTGSSERNELEYLSHFKMRQPLLDVNTFPQFPNPIGLHQREKRKRRRKSRKHLFIPAYDLGYVMCVYGWKVRILELDEAKWE